MDAEESVKSAQEPEKTKDGIRSKKQRKRKKQLHHDIKKQMEFYFSDANLTKDRFLGGLIREKPEGYVDLEVFKAFNKLKALSTDLKVIAKALSFSKMLELNKDGTKVRRSTPIKNRKDVDERTVYVECLPWKVDHDWVKRVFSACGKVVYVSLPKFKTSTDFKGFGFVEFATVDQAKLAVKTLNNPPIGAPIGKFPKTSKQIIQLQRKQQEIPESGTGQKGFLQDFVCTTRKRTYSDGDQEYIKPKRQRTVSENNASHDNTLSDNVTFRIGSETSSDSDNDQNENFTSSKKPKKSADEDIAESKGEKETIEVGNAKNKVNKIRKNKKSREKCKDIPRIRVLFKKEWLSLRNEYLHLQKKNMTDLKEAISHYKEKEKEKEMAIKDQKTKINFIPGVIIHVKTEKPSNRKSLKELLNSDDIVYIDFKDEENEGHVRFSNADVAKSLVDKNFKGLNLKLLKDDEETQYWKQINADREKKLSSKLKNKKRGSEKVLRKADRIVTDVNKKQHVFFDEDD